MGAKGVLRTLQGGRLAFWCPGCEHLHAVRVEGGAPSWGFNGNYERPTFTPSVLVTARDPDPPHNNLSVCHSFVTDGRVQFLGDCTHDLAGQTVDLAPFAPDHGP